MFKESPASSSSSDDSLMPISASELEQRLQIIGRALRACGEMVEHMREQLDESNIETKAQANDLVTRSDKACDHLLKKCITEAFSNEPILTEESGLTWPQLENLHAQPANPSWSEIKKLESLWIADPIDGTTNYIHGLEHYAICLAWMSYGRVQAAGIYLPSNAQLYLAAKGMGTTCNGLKVKVSNTQYLKDALLGTGFGYLGKGQNLQFLHEIGHLADHTHGVRHLGSAACCLAKVACGQLDGFWIRQVKLWDIVSGILIVQEAGGQVTAIEEGTDFFETGSVIAANDFLLPQIAKSISVFKG